MSRKFLRDRAQRQAFYTPRPFNAQVYDIPSSEYCRVLVQGSINPVVAWFSRNMHHRPGELKIGNAILCQYKLGNRGQIEVIGNGTVIPTRIAGQPEVVIPAGPDAILTGLQVLAIPQI
ncbi:MAG: hypothetical protein A4E66_00170 [Syntrophus sp. PtaB.Bin001]|nr:MAG: hypothetical protein A4E66_00170 [Syntrophus sp. PtaB.Bin001]